MITNELMRATKASYRQIDYWARIGIIEPNVPAHGSGSRRDWDPELIPVLDTLAEISGYFRTPPRALLQEVAANYGRGYVQITPNIRLSWGTKGTP